ncbi:MAG: tRNA (N(6)-L-threonylcarbamoyladenosine(37)-C(2))-methylthiotransferase MtaB, partial [Candidatus Neomarinimicrobiota bacterium]|nr:tRNA (N(6)-L-threonylcarbamoyladenosine(37)-C(2))-methylthiotransferase MtaB [Candidatus Neomarinimicrobiota bacterium]
RVAFHTMGCKTNFSETSTISSEMMAHGLQQVSFKDKADVYVLNSCSVTENADKEARKLIRQARRRNPDAAVAVIGCYAQLQPADIAAIPGVDLVVGAAEKFNLFSHISSLKANGKATVIQSPIESVKSFQPSFSAAERTRTYLKIQDGCDYNCSFCTIPLARGRSRSDNISNTVNIAQQIADTEAREIVLTGVNIGDYGVAGEEDFFQLIQALDNVNGIDRFRISSIEPNLLTDEIIAFCAHSKKFVPHFHIPLQSGTDSILRRMKRRYDTALYSSRIDKINNLIPDCCIGVDVIVGFPGEDEKDFLTTRSFLKNLDISYLHVFSFSDRVNTEAASLNNKVSKEEKAYRSKTLHMLSDEKRFEFHEKSLKQIRSVLFERSVNGTNQGYTDNYIKVQVAADMNYENKLLKVTLNKNHGSYMSGLVTE